MRTLCPPAHGLRWFRLSWGIFLLVLVSPSSGRAEEWPGEKWTRAAPDEVGLDAVKLKQARKYARSAGGAGYITRRGKLLMDWGETRRRFDLKSTSKSIGITALGLAIADGKMTLADRVRQHHPTLGVPPEGNADSGWLEEITLFHLATQTAGFAKPGGYEPLLFRPGTKWHYSDGGPNWLAECVTRAYGRDLQDLLFERFFSPIGISRKGLRWRINAYRPHLMDGVPRREFGSGVHANVDALARIGLLYLRRGRWRDQQLLPAEFVDQASRPQPELIGLPEHKVDGRPGGEHGNASDHYGLLWWNNADGTLANVPRDAYWSWGLYDSLIVVIPSLDIVVSRVGRSWPREEGAGHYDVLRPFLEPIVASVKLPAPRSPVIQDVLWAPADSIVRLAEGSDNWPLTWADDGYYYTAYGDGWGFETRTEQKLSLGLARVIGQPPELQAENIRSPTAEHVGQGKEGVKASGMLCVDGVLYLLARNAGNAQLAWSHDHGATWEWADWKFTTSFGCPTFVNYGQNYAGAVDEFVYLFSPDSGSAYEPADRFVLARVPKDRLREQAAYEYFQELEDGQPLWTEEIEQRGSVFSHPGRCYRGGITYHPVLRRYLWCQILPESRDSRGPRFEGGFGIYDAPHPWGPWTTAYFTEHWDVGPGETSSLPTPWMSSDGKAVHLLFSGDDYFSVRRATLVTADDSQP